MPFQFLHLDTEYSEYSSDNTNNTYVFDNSNQNAWINSFNTVFSLSRPITGCKRMYLKSVEMPLVFNTVRAANNSNILSIYPYSDPNTVYTIILPDKSYSSVSTLLNDINSALSTNYPSLGITFQMNGNLVQMNYPTTSQWDYGANFQDNLLTQTILGFDPAFYVFENPNGVLLGNWLPQLNYDLYLNMLFYKFPNNNPNNGLVPCSFKLPLNAPNGPGIVYYNGENSTFLQYIDIPENTTINQIGIAILDRYGFSINNGGSDWSLTLLLES